MDVLEGINLGEECSCGGDRRVIYGTYWDGLGMMEHLVNQDSGILIKKGSVFIKIR